MNIQETLKILNCCVVIPTYNNEKTVVRVIDEVLAQIKGAATLIVVNDGSTDSTFGILNDFGDKIDLVSYEQNKGKGFALRQGFKRAEDLGFENVITMDSDGQHYADDIASILAVAKEHPESVVMGARNMNQEGVPGKSSFGNKFSNFWFWAFTFIKLDDTQTGFRLYPLKPITRLRLFSNKFELEIELIVRLAWRGVKFVKAPVKVLYDSEERVTHFRPFADFMRISALNTVLFLICLVYYYPKRFFSLDTLRVIRDEAIKPNESNLNKALSISFGCFMGVVPIWGFQLLVGVPLAVAFRLNKVLFVSAAHISIPPFIPIILYFSLVFGNYLIGGIMELPNIWDTSFSSIISNMKIYVIGAIAFALVLAVTSFMLSLGVLRFFRPKKG